MPNIIRDVVEALQFQQISGRTASVYGALPWRTAREKAEWTLTHVGYTWRLTDGTVGLSRQPAATYEEAIAIMATVNQA